MANEDPTSSLDEASDTAMSTVNDMFGSFVAHLPYVAGALAVLFLTWAISALVNNFGNRLLSHWQQRESLKDLILRLVTIVIWVLGLLMSAIILFPGVTPSKALGGLGLVSIAVGLAFKDIFENFFAGILILLRFPFERGDYIECQGIVGRVERVLFRMSYVREPSGELVVVPNAFLFKNPVTVLTSEPTRRVTLMTGIAYGESIEQALPVIEQALQSCQSINKEQPTEIFPQAFGSSSIDIEVCWWTQSTPLGIRQSRGEAITAIKRELDAAGIEIPFPYRTLTFNEPLPVRQVASSGD